MKNANACSRLQGLPPVTDLSNQVVEVLIQCMEWNITTHQSSFAESALPAQHQKDVDLLDLLQQNLPDKTGEKGKWNFKKTHSILHKVSEMVLWGNLDNPSCQAVKVCPSIYLYMHNMYCVVTAPLAEWLRWKQGPVTYQLGLYGFNSSYPQHTICAFFALTWAV